MRDFYDVVVAGGGPAGLAAAIAARQAGFEVAVFDVAVPPIDKSCGEGILPDGIAALSQLGITLNENDGIPFRGIRFLQRGVCASATFTSSFGLGIRRTILHRILVEQAASAGVSLHWGTRIGGLSPEGFLVNGSMIGARWIIGADGQNSQVRRWAGLESNYTAAHRYGFRCHFAVAPWSEYVDVHWSDCGQLYVSPVGAKEVCMAFLTRDPRLRFSDVYRLFPEVADRLTTASSREMGAVTAMRRLHSVHRDRYALIGDASGSVDAITGEGLSLTFRQSLALGEALRRNDLSGYEQNHRRIQRVPRTMAQLLLLMDRHPQLRSRVLRMLSLHPALFQRFLNVHTGTTPFAGRSAAILAAGPVCTVQTRDEELAITKLRMPAPPAPRTSRSRPEHEI